MLLDPTEHSSQYVSPTAHPKLYYNKADDYIYLGVSYGMSFGHKLLYTSSTSYTFERPTVYKYKIGATTIDQSLTSCMTYPDT